jgi:hypothetical protein
MLPRWYAPPPHGGTFADLVCGGSSSTTLLVDLVRPPAASPNVAAAGARIGEARFAAAARAAMLPR